MASEEDFDFDVEERIMPSEEDCDFDVEERIMPSEEDFDFDVEERIMPSEEDFDFDVEERIMPSEEDFDFDVEEHLDAFADSVSDEATDIQDFFGSETGSECVAIAAPVNQNTKENKPKKTVRSLENASSTSRSSEHKSSNVMSVSEVDLMTKLFINSFCDPDDCDSSSEHKSSAEMSATENDMLRELSEAFNSCVGFFAQRSRKTEPFSALRTFEILRLKRGNTDQEFNSFVTDMANAVLYFITHGTKFKSLHFEKISLGSNFSYMEELIKRYSIIDTKPGCTDNVTLARIAYTFPFLVCLLLNEGFGRVKGKPFKLARALAWSGAPCIIPIDYTEAFAKWKKWNSSFIKTIKSEESDENCVNFALESTWLTQEEKKEIFKRYDIASDGSQLSETKSNPQDKCLVEEFGLEYFGDISDEFSISLIKKFCDQYHKPKS